MLYTVDRNLRPNVIRYGYGLESLDNGITQGLRLGPELVSDGDMEAANTSAWTPNSGATLSKQTADPYEGMRNLQVLTGAGDATSQANQNILTAGTEYLVCGYYKTDGIANGLIGIGSGVQIVMTNPTVWTYFEYRRTASGAGVLQIGTFKNPPHGSSTTVQYDAVSAREIISG